MKGLSHSVGNVLNSGIRDVVGDVALSAAERLAYLGLNVVRPLNELNVAAARALRQLGIISRLPKGVDGIERSLSRLIGKLEPSGYECAEEGLFYPDDIDAAQFNVLERFIEDPRNSPQIDQKRFPPPIRLTLYSRSAFVERVLWRAIRNGAMIVGFNLPFDLSRLAVKSAPADDGGWSLVLSMRRSRKTGEMEANPERPRIVISAKDSKLAFISLKGIRHPKEWPHGGRFLDLRTLGWALRNESYTLDSACRDFHVPGKLAHKPTGLVTFKEIKYCLQDGRATTDLLNAMKREFDQHPFELQPDRAYSPASIAKAYLDAMNIARPNGSGSIGLKDLLVAVNCDASRRHEKWPSPKLWAGLVFSSR
jgi:hypothetical protein